MQAYANLFTSIKIADCHIKNRFAMAPMGPLGLSDTDGGFSQRGIDYYTERARGGTGLLITGVTLVDTDIEEVIMPNLPCSTYKPIHFIRTSRELTERVHAYNAKIFLQMTAGFGRVGIPTNLGEFPPVAPSSIPHRWLDRTCRELTKQEILTLVQKFGEGAYNAKRAGFDGVEIHAVHEGYLLDQFAISLFNNREDEYGGSLENRLRFAKEIVACIKETCGKEFPVVLRYSLKSFIKDLRSGALPGEEFIEKGRDIPEGIEAAKLLVQYGYDALDVDVGSYDAWWWSHPPMYQEKGLYLPYAKILKESVDVPVICAGRMDDPKLSSEAVSAGICDIIGLGRPLLADPEYTNKLRKGKQHLIRPCLSCQEGCMGRIQVYSAINCAVNPHVARERATRLIPAERSKKVLIIGGGIAGCEAARVLKLRGHVPVIIEKTDHLGGNLIPGGVPPFKVDDRLLAQWYANTLQTLNIEIHTNAEASIHDVPGYDAVIVASGSRPRKLFLGDDDRTFTAAQVLMGEKKPGADTVIVGGGLVGCELAMWLHDKGINVTIVEALSQILRVNRPTCSANADMLENMISYKGISVITDARAIGYKNRILTLDKGCNIECDSVILAIGYEENRDLYTELEPIVEEIYLVGDSRKVSNIMYAIWDSFEIASHI